MWRQGYSRICHPLTILPTIEGNLTFKKEPFIQADERLILHFYRGKMDCYFDTRKEEYYYQFVLMKNLEDAGFMDKVEKEIRSTMDELLEFSKQFINKNLSDIEKDELIEMLWGFDKRYAKIFGYGLVNTYDRDLVEYVKKYYIERWGEKKGLHYFTILTSTAEDTYYEKEKKDLLSAAIEFNNNKKDTLLNKLAEKLEKKYNWLYINYEGDLRKRGDFAKLIKETLKNNPDPQKSLESLTNKKKGLISEKEEFEKKLDIDPDIIRLSEAIHVNAFLREYRKPLAVQALYHQRFLLKEIAKRLSLTLIELKFLLPAEIKEALDNKKLNNFMIQERIKESVYDLRENDYKILVGNEARTLVKKIKDIEKNLEEDALVKGVIACPGVVKGKVRLVLTVENGKSFKEGEIFVSPATSPELIQFIKKAKAIVTDEGGLTSHAAIVSREIGIPCIVGTKNATKTLKDGDMVEVNAEKGIVNIIN